MNARRRKPRDSPKTIQGGVHAGQDIVFGDQHTHHHHADLSHIEATLDSILDLLRKADTSLRVLYRERGKPFISLTGTDGKTIEVPPEFAGALGEIQRSSIPKRREEIYLARFTLDQLYARWGRAYLPLEGMLRMEASLRLTDASDQGISPAGIRIQDIRQALTELEKPRLIILGEPGAGKTTTLERLALDVSRQRLRDPVNGKIPIRIDLFKFNDQRNPSDFLAGEWLNTGLAETYGEAISRGQVCFLLDGINQMPSEDRTRRIEKWAHWANSPADLPQGNQAIFTCRTADYTSSLRLPEVHVQALDRERMRYYFELRFGPEEAPRMWGEFDRRLSSGDHLFERLARNPFMLSLLADNAAEGKGLSDNRAQLMDGLAMRLLDHELQEGRQPQALTDDKLATLNAAMYLLSRMAFSMQSRGEGTSITEDEACQIPLSEGPTRSHSLTLDDLLNLSLSAHILEPTQVQSGESRQPGYIFYHHLLQEYFAARRLLDLFRAGQSLGRYIRVAWRWWQLWSLPLQHGQSLDPPPVTGWEQTCIMTSNLAGRDLSRLVNHLAKQNLPLAGRCLAAADPQRLDTCDAKDLLRRRLMDRQHNPFAHLRARLDAGLSLGELGHPELLPKEYEIEGGLVTAVLPPMQPVPQGEFLFGSDPSDKLAYAVEITSQRQQHTEAFSIGRYPVTNAEFRWFIVAGGYQDNRWWSPAGLSWKRGGPQAHAGVIEDLMKSRDYYKTVDLDTFARGIWLPGTRSFWKRLVALEGEALIERLRKQFERPFDKPAFWEDLELSSPARPVVGVNWFEAQAYCRWLSAVTGHTLRLPTEIEWEKAARSIDGRVYPWGNRFNAKNANTQESHLYTTTPVGLYPAGCAPYGLYDCSGNVLEWTQSYYSAYPGSEAENERFGESHYVLRGGSWNGTRRDARCASRGRNVPDNFGNLVGFRVLSPGILLDSGC